MIHIKCSGVTRIDENPLVIVKIYNENTQGWFGWAKAEGKLCLLCPRTQHPVSGDDDDDDVIMMMMMMMMTTLSKLMMFMMTQVRVQARNKHGWGGFSENFTFSTRATGEILKIVFFFHGADRWSVINNQWSVIVLISGDIPKELPVEVHSSGITGLKTITITITSRRPLELSYNTEKNYWHQAVCHAYKALLTPKYGIYW